MEKPTRPGARTSEEKGQWLQIDLGITHNLTGSEIHWETGDGEYQYKIEGSQNNQEWTLLIDKTETEDKSQIQRHYYKANSIRYIRITITGKKEKTTTGITEFKVFGEIRWAKKVGRVG